MALDVETVPLPASKTLLTELWSIWSNGLDIFRRNFEALRDELAAATWRRFFLTIISTIFLGQGLYRLLLGLFDKLIFERSGRPFPNLGSYWVVLTAWSTVTSALINIPFVLLVAYLSYYWVSHQDEESHWVQEAQMLASTWTITSICIHLVNILGLIVIFLSTRNPETFALHPNISKGTIAILNFVFYGLLTAPFVAYRYNLRLHGNRILNGLTGRDRWILLGFQIIMLEGGTLFVSRFLLHLPIVENLYQQLLRFTM